MLLVDKERKVKHTSVTAFKNTQAQQRNQLCKRKARMAGIIRGGMDGKELTEN